MSAVVRCLKKIKDADFCRQRGFKLPNHLKSISKVVSWPSEVSMSGYATRELDDLKQPPGQQLVSHSTACHAHEHSHFRSSCIPRPEKNATCADMNHKSNQRGNKPYAVPTPIRVPSKDKLND